MKIELKEIDPVSFRHWLAVMQDYDDGQLQSNLRYAEMRYCDTGSVSSMVGTAWGIAGEKHGLGQMEVYEIWWAGIYGMLEEEAIARGLEL